MIKFITAIATFLRNCASSCVSLLKVMLLSRPVRIPKAGKETCVLLGNGASLNTLMEKSPSFLDDKEVFCVNHFANTDLFTKIKPSNYFILDANFWIFKGDASHPTAKMLQSLEKQTTWPLRLFLPHAAKRSALLMSLPKKNSNIELVFFNYTVVKGFRWLEYLLFRNNLGMPQCQNVMVAACFMSVNMGYKTGYLLGAEHNWVVNLHVGEDNMVYVKDDHFYQDPSKEIYRKFYITDEKKKTFSMQLILHTFAKIFYGYERVRKYADAMGSRIYNATPGSFIDAFERIKL
jgi:hypothetical protein